MKDFLHQNGILLVIIAVLAAVILSLAVSVLGFDPLGNALGILAAPFRSAAASVSQWVEDRYGYAFRYEQLVEENAALKKRIAALEEEIRYAEDANRQNELYRQLIGLAEKRADFKFQDAAVTMRSVSNWNSTFTIDKGMNVDIEAGDCVVDEYGNLVGVVSEVGFNYATVASIIDSTTELGARLLRTDHNAVLEGDFTLMKEGKLFLNYLPRDAQPISGDQIVTSGLGDTYPAGLLVGYVESIHTDANGLTRYAVVNPAADLNSLRYVFVIKDFDVVN